MRMPQGLQGSATRPPLFLGAVLALVVAAGCKGCDEPTNYDPDAFDIGDIDADSDGSGDVDPDGAGDADGSGDPTPRSIVFPSPAGGTVAGEDHRLIIRFGGPQPAGAASGSGHGIVVGPGAARP